MDRRSDSESHPEIHELQEKIRILAEENRALRERAMAQNHSEERYRSLFSQMIEGFALGEPVLDDQGRPKDIRFLEINRAFEQQTGLSRDIIGRRLTEVLPNLEQVWITNYCGVALGGEPVRFEQYNKDTDRYYDVYCYRPAPAQFAILFRDITWEKRAQASLRESEERFRATFEQAAVGMAHVGLDGTFLRLNQKLCEIVGYTPQELQKKTFMDITFPEDLDIDLAQAQKLHRGEIDNYRMEKRYVHKNGHPVWINLTGALQRDPSGTPQFFIAAIEDISERKRAEERLHLALETAQMGVWELDLDGKNATRSIEHDRIFGYSTPPAEWNYRIFLEHVLPEDRAGVDEKFHQAISSGRDWQFQCRIRRTDGQVRWIETRGRIFSRDCRGDRMVGLVADITDRKDLEENLSQARVAAESANRAKSEFLANMSHEIRTPMTVFMGVIQQLMQTEKDPQRLPQLKMADQSAKRLRYLIDDILDFSKLEAGKMKFEENPFDLRAWIREILDMFVLSAQEKNLELELSVEPDIPEVIVGDANRLGQVLINLIDNAIKFTSQGGVRVHINRDAAHLKMTVADTGIGFPEEKRDRIFESFTQLDASFHRQYGGTGLGLAISKGLVKLMNGEISAASQPEKGSTFTFTIPLKTAPAPARTRDKTPAESPSAERTGRVLLVDDEPMIREMISRILERRGLQVETAVSGRDALTKWESADYDLIIMDLQMPEMDGLEVTRAIRGREQEGEKPICIIGLTAHARSVIRNECMNAGMNHVLTKPVQIVALYETIDACLVLP